MAKQKIYQIDEAAKREFDRLFKKVDGMRGDGVKNSPGSIVISQTAQSKAKVQQPDQIIFATITGNSQDGSNLRWKYSWTQVAKTAAGFGGWTTVSGGLSGTTSSNIGYNTFENMNGASGTFGNGVASTNLVGTFAVQPAPNNLIVRMTRVTIGTTTEYHFFYANGVDGACP